MAQSGLILPREYATAEQGLSPRLVASAAPYFRDPACVFGIDYSRGFRDLVTGALPTSASIIGGSTALGPGLATDATRTGLVYAAPPGLPASITVCSFAIVIKPSNATTGTTLYIAAMGPSGDPTWSIVCDTTNLRYGILENSFTWAA